MIENVKKIGIDTDFVYYETLKGMHVVGQGWKSSGDLSFLWELKDNSMKYLSCFGWNGDKGWENTFKHFVGNKQFKAGDIVLAYEGNSLRGICEIPVEHIYYYHDEIEEYRNTIYPVNWIDWSEFCDRRDFDDLNARGVPGVQNCWTNVRDYIMDHWEPYKKQNEILVFPRECRDKYDERKEQLPQRIKESKQQIERRMEQSKIANYKTLLKQTKNMILSGAPGTGKTYLAKLIAKGIVGEELYDLNSKMVQFHPSSDYTDFVEGLRPIQNEDNTIGFKRQDGIFKAFCAKAAKDMENNYVFIIDEINRGEISKIFGELFYSIEPNYRGQKGKIQTQYQNLVAVDDTFNDGFYVPENVYVIGTMNDIDRSVESMDFAMRRRFTFKEVTAEERIDDILNKEVLNHLSEDSISTIKSKLRNLNKKISSIQLLGESYHIGPAYFAHLKHLCNDKNEPDFEALWQLHLRPLLHEYLRGLPNAVTLLAELKTVYDEQPS